MSKQNLSDAQPDQSSADETLKSVLGEQLFNDYANLVETDREFMALDRDDNEFLSKEELTDPTRRVRPDRPQIVDNFEVIQNAHDDEYGAENSGITREDLTSAFTNSAKALAADGKVHTTENGVDVWSIGEKDEGLQFLEIYDKSRQAHVEWHPFQLAVHNSSFDVPPYSEEWASKQKAKEERQELAADLFRGAPLGPAVSSYENLINGGAYGAFDKIDSDKNGFLNKEELDTFSQNSEPGPEDRAAQRMSVWIDKIEEASDDEVGDENDGITKADLEQDLINEAFDADVEGRIETLLQWGLPGGRTDNDHWSERSYELGAVSFFKDSDSQRITIEDPRRGFTTEIRFSDGTFSNSYSVEVSKDD